VFSKGSTITTSAAGFCARAVEKPANKRTKTNLRLKNRMPYCSRTARTAKAEVATDQCESVALHRIDERNVVVLSEVYVGLGVAFGIAGEEMKDTVAIDPGTY
jgi:hypothetical protein